jgi:UDP-N-acetylmuramoylalanine--D-glutamate ligase
LTEAALAATATDWMVVELSSFQLKGTQTFRPRIACLLNVYETHLDYHGTMEDYEASKAKIFHNQLPEDTAVITWDDPACRSLIPEIKAKLLPFSMKEALPNGVYLDEAAQTLVYSDAEGSKISILAAKEMGMPGSYNIENALAAAAAALTAGVKPDAIAEVLRSFRGVEHRLEFVRELDGITFYNNSKATNPAAAIKSMEAFEQRIVLIAGGLDRGSDYMELLPIFRDRVKAIITLGETKEKINHVAHLAGISLIQTVDTANNAADAVALAVQKAWSLSETGDIVLLSPACASWDMFPSYEDRGRMFKESVHNL